MPWNKDSYENHPGFNGMSQGFWLLLKWLLPHRPSHRMFKHENFEVRIMVGLTLHRLFWCWWLLGIFFMHPSILLQIFIGNTLLENPLNRILQLYFCWSYIISDIYIYYILSNLYLDLTMKSFQDKSVDIFRRSLGKPPNRPTFKVKLPGFWGGQFFACYVSFRAGRF